MVAAIVKRIDPGPGEGGGWGHWQEGLFEQFHGQRHADILDGQRIKLSGGE